jgi:hypothetical protein
MRVVCLAAATAAAVCALTGCSDRVPSAPVTLRPASEVDASRADAAAKIIPLGQSGELADGGGGRTTVIITSMSVDSDDTGRWLRVGARFDNRGTQDAKVPNVGIVCHGSVRTGSYQIGSTISLGDDLPAGSVKNGSLDLLLPGVDHAGAKAAPCPAPAFVEVSPLSYYGDAPPLLRVAIPAATLAKLTAKQAPPS